MNQLQIINQNGQLLADSREIAEMIAKPHDQLMRSIRTYIEYLTSAKMQTLEFFKESTYVDGKGEIRPCYLLTKKGCDMVANKMTGEKGVLFTAIYVTRFEEMEKQTKQAPALSERQAIIQSLKLTAELAEEQEEIKGKIVELEQKVDHQITIDHGEQRKVQRTIAKRVYAQSPSMEERKRLFRELHREIKDRFGVASYKDIKRKELHAALSYIEYWIPRKVS